MSRSGSQNDRLQTFLEQAALIALNEPAIDSATWSKLKVLALENGLPDGTWEAELQRVLGDGVVWLDPPVEGMEFTSPVRSGAKPPPLPSRRKVAQPPPPPDAPPAPVPPPPPTNVAVEEVEQPLQVDSEILFVDSVGNPAGSFAAPPPPPGYPQPPALPTPPEFAGDEVSPGNVEPPHVIDEKNAPEPPQPNKRQKPQKTPHDRFHAYIEKALALMSTRVITRKKEAKLVTEGCAKLGLAEPYARWIVSEVAAEHGVPVLSQQQASSEATDQDEDETSARIEAFMQRVPSIIAEQRGVNARSRMLMEAVGQELGLSSDEFEMAMQLLQGGDANVAATADEDQVALREAGYREWLVDKVRQLPHGILTAAQEADLMDTGVLYHGVDDDRASKVIREVCAASSVRFISLEQAKQHVAELVDDKLAANTWIASEVRTRILSEGAQWGLDNADCAELIAEAIEVNRHQKKKSRSVATIAMAAAVLVFLAAGGGAAWYAYSQQQIAAEEGENPDGATPGDTGAESTGGDAAAAAADGEPKKWLDRDLELAIANARIGWEEARPLLKQIREGVALERDEAYQNLLRMSAEEIPSNQRDLLTGIFAGAYAREPFEPNATRLRDSLRDLLQSDQPFEDGQLDRIFWAVRIAAKTIARENIPADRLEPLIRVVGDALGVVVDGDQNADAIEETCTAALCRQLYRKLGKAVTLPAKQFESAMARLGEMAHRYMDESEYERLEVQLLVDAIRGSEARWVPLSKQLRRRAGSSDNNSVLRLLELFEQAKDEDFKAFLGAVFATNSRLVKTRVTLDDVAEEVRKNLGVPRETTFDDRWRQFDTLSQAALDADDGATEPAKLFRQAVQLTHAANAGQALALRELGASVFDDLIREGPPKIETIGGGSSRASAARRGMRSAAAMNFNLPGAASERMDQLMRTLNISSRPDTRIRTLKLFSASAHAIQQLSPRYSYDLAHYLASPKQTLEHQSMMELIPSFRHWKHLRLAMADEIREASAKDPQLNELVEALAEQNFSQGETDAWKRAVRRSLLRSVLLESGSGATEVSDSTAVDRSVKWIKTYYADRAKMLGAPADQAASVATASAASRLLVDRLAAKLNAGKTNAEVQTSLESLPHRQAAIEFAAENEMVQFVMLQRIAVELTMYLAIRQQPEREEAIREKKSDLEHFDRTAENVMLQLREGERTLVFLWRIVNQP